MAARLSSPISSIKSHYTAVVIGSGYGGGITASRLARAGQRVCLLERGKEFQPGEFPDTALEAAAQMQLDKPGSHLGSRTGLFDFRLNDDMCVLLGCGLGGTSLINANVSIRPEPRVFLDARWPKAIREDFAGLDAGFKRAAAMLKPEKHDRKKFPLAKLDALEKSAGKVGAPFGLLDINVNYTVDGPNHVGVEQKPCTLCGDCVSGCNHQAKNTTLMNYLPDAVNHGAEVYTRCSVRHLERRDGRWVVHYQLVESGREAFDAPTAFVTADLVVLAAGTLGSTEILLRSREQGLALSDRLGERFSGNGDVLGFSYNAEQHVNGVGYGHRRAPPNGQVVGPCIAGVIDQREQAVLEHGMIIQEGSVPGALAAVLPLPLSLGASLAGKDTDSGVADALAEAGREAESLVGGPYSGAVRNTQTYLVMTHDDGQGRMKLSEDRLRIDWKGLADEPIFTRVAANLLKATEALGGTFLANPLTSKLLGRELVTVHPLGGCCMGEDAQGGVTNHKGQVFSGQAGSGVHEGLYVADGSVIPRPLGVNPLLTISAVAERSARLMVEERGWRFDEGATSTPRPPAPPLPVGLQFTEMMHGHLSLKVLTDYAPAEAQGKEDRSPLRFVITIISDDVERMMKQPDSPARLSGTVEAPALAARPLAVTGGSFQLLSREGCPPGLGYMKYAMTLTSEEGRTWFLSGFKVIRDDGHLDVWSDTTTLYVTLRETDAGGPVVGKGVIRLNAADFSKQLATFEVTNAKDLRHRLEVMARFGQAFAGTLWSIYGGVCAGDSAFTSKAAPRKKRALRAPAPAVYPFQTKDGVALRLTRYQGGTKGPVMLAHGLGVSGFIFTVDTIETNLVEYLCAHGYDVWNLEHRASTALPVSAQPYSGDDIAQYDYPAAVDKVREVTGRKSIQMVAHCYGATTLTMALLNGLEGVRSVAFSQVSAHAEVPFATALKSGLHLPEVMEALGIKSLSAYAGETPDWHERLFSSAVKQQPMAEEDRCPEDVCRRIAFLYGVLYEHRNLNAATHAAMHELFGLANIRAFEHLARITREHHVVGFQGEERYLPHPERMKLPITFIGGALNRCWLPKNLVETYEWLVQANGPSLYTRHLIPGYGHIDCIFGENAYKDVYPYVLAHLEATLDESFRGFETQSLPPPTPRSEERKPSLPVPGPMPLPFPAVPPPLPAPVFTPPLPRAGPRLQAAVQVPPAFVNLFRVAGTANFLMALPFLFAQDRAGELLGTPPVGLPLVGWMFGAFVALLGVMFWEISGDLEHRYEMIKYGWMAKLAAAVCTTIAFTTGQVPMAAMIATAVGDIFWIPLFIGVQRSMARRVSEAEQAGAQPSLAA